MDLTTVNYRKELLDAAGSYCRRHKITLAKLGKIVMNDHRFFTEMRDENRGCTVDTFQRVMRELSEESIIESPKKELTEVFPINDCR
jgi:hypothetical protein